MFGILTPSMVGITVLSYEYDKHKEMISSMISIAIAVLVVQFGFSILAIIYKWDDELAYAYEASQDYNDLHDSFKRLAELPPSNLIDLEKSYDLLNTRYRSRQQQDTKHNIKEWELRKGMRWALRQYKKPCYGCRKTILSMESTDCEVCGNFSKKHRLKTVFKL